MNKRLILAPLLLAMDVVSLLSGCSILHPRHVTAKRDVPTRATNNPPTLQRLLPALPPPLSPKLDLHKITLESLRSLPTGRSDLAAGLSEERDTLFSHSHTRIDPLYVALQDAVKNAKQGQMSYNPPEKMTEGQTVRITAQLLRPDARGMIVASPGPLLGPGSLQAENLAISEEMHITLISVEPGAFDIREDDTSHDGIQTILLGHGANWYWDVTPKISGVEHLLLVASIVVRTGQDERQQDLPSIQKTILVSVLPAPPLRERILTTLSGFLERNWKWLLGLLPLGEITRRLLIRSKVGRAILPNLPETKKKHDEVEVAANEEDASRVEDKETKTKAS